MSIGLSNKSTKDDIASYRIIVNTAFVNRHQERKTLKKEHGVLQTGQTFSCSAQSEQQSWWPCKTTDLGEKV